MNNYSRRGKTTNVIIICGLLFSNLFYSCQQEHRHCALCVEKKADTTAYSMQLNQLNHFISLDSALEWTKNFVGLSQEILDGRFKGDSTIFPIYETFNLKIIDSIIVNPKTIGLRIYLAAARDNKLRFVLTGVDDMGRDMVLDGLEGKSTQMQRFGGDQQPEKNKTKYMEAIGETGQRHPPVKPLPQ